MGQVHNTNFKRNKVLTFGRHGRTSKQIDMEYHDCGTEFMVVIPYFVDRQFYFLTSDTVQQDNKNQMVPSQHSQINYYQSQNQKRQQFVRKQISALDHLMLANQQFVITGQNNYKIDSIFEATDYILPINATSTHFEEILKGAETNQQYCQKGCIHKDSIECARENFQNQNFACTLKSKPELSEFEFSSLDLSQKLQEADSSATRSTNQNSGSGSNGSRGNSTDQSSPISEVRILNAPSQNNYMEIMMERWQKSLKPIPNVDKVDIRQENSLFNNRLCQIENPHQHDPEFSQTSYLRLRSLEEAMAIRNYLDPKYEVKKNFAQKLQHQITSKLSSHQLISQYDRSFAIQKIFDLHIKKRYKNETLFVACSILDRYLAVIGWQTYPREKICLLATVSILLAAKLEQPISPSFSKMVSLLSEDEKKSISFSQMVKLEADILVKLSFDFNFASPIQSMERYLRLLNYDQNQIVYDMSYQICKFQLNDSMFLDYRPSQIAAAACLISINIFERDQEKQKKPKVSFFKTNSDGSKIFNTDIWNNADIARTSGYSIEYLQNVLYDLASFIKNNLTPNRLEGFKLEKLKELVNFQPTDSDNLHLILQKI